MKKINLITLVLALGLALGFAGCGSSDKAVPATKAKAEVVYDTAKLIDIEKQGFLTVESCAKQGAFLDCRMENYICGSDDCYKNVEPGVMSDVQLVLYSHKEGITYNLDVTAIAPSLIDTGINRNDVTLIGKYDAMSNTIIASEFKAPPPPKKSFFKGCL